MINNTTIKIPKKHQPFLHSLTFINNEYILVARDNFTFNNQNSSIITAHRQKDIIEAMGSIKPNEEVNTRKDLVKMLLEDVSLEQKESKINLGVFHPDIEHISERDFLKVLEMVVGVTEGKTQERDFSGYWVEVDCKKSHGGAVVNISIKEE